MLFRSPMVIEPKEAFSLLLCCIKEHSLIPRWANILPHLKSFLTDPIIQEILEASQMPAKTPDNNQQAQLTNIHSTLQSLSKVIANIQKQLNTLPKVQATPLQKEAKSFNKQSCKTYLATARVRPPNPSLVVDLAHMVPTEEDRPRPEIICNTLNRGLGSISPPQVSLATVRWTARGNLVITRGPSTMPHSLLAAAPHVTNILNEALKFSPNNPLPTA